MLTATAALRWCAPAVAMRTAEPHRKDLWAQPALTPYGQVLALDDVIGTKVRALAARAAPRDFVDVRAADQDHTTADLKMLGKRHGRGQFRLDDLRDRLGTAQWIDDEEFEVYGLSADDISELRQWVSDIEQRLSTGMDHGLDS